MFKYFKNKKSLSDRVEELEAEASNLRESLHTANHMRLYWYDQYVERGREVGEAMSSVNKLQMLLKEGHPDGADQFTQGELKILRGLCHPDKHGNRESSVIMTQKLNELVRR